MTGLANAVTGFFEGFPAWLNALLALVTAASAATALTPTAADDRLLGRVRRVLEWLALNVGHARPAAPKAPERPVR